MYGLSTNVAYFYLLSDDGVDAGTDDAGAGGALDFCLGCSANDGQQFPIILTLLLALLIPLLLFILMMLDLVAVRYSALNIIIINNNIVSVYTIQYNTTLHNIT